MPPVEFSIVSNEPRKGSGLPETAVDLETLEVLA
jgi:hypothetical protein